MRIDTNYGMYVLSIIHCMYNVMYNNLDPELLDLICLQLLSQPLHGTLLAGLTGSLPIPA